MDWLPFVLAERQRGDGEARHADLPPIAHLPRAGRRQTRVAGLLIGLVGVAGFIGLLIAARRLPDQATGLRALAIVWLLAAGGLKLLVRYGREG